MIAAKQFTSAAEILANAAAVRKRLFNPPKPKTQAANTNVVVTIKQVPKAQPAPRKSGKASKPPEWQTGPCMFEEHVIAYRIEKALRDMQASGEIELGIDRRNTVASIVGAILKDYPEFSAADLRGARRTKRLTRVRHLAMWEVHRKRPDMSYPAIGRWFGGRDHTTVMHAVKQVEARKAAEQRLD